MAEITGLPLEPEGSSSNRSLLLLRGTPWCSVVIPPEVLNVTTMLSISERELLYWLARDYYIGVGKIVDGGCFLGGSTLSLGRGVIDGGHAAESPTIHTYDLFVSNSYMVDYYFKPLGITQAEGESFRPLFDVNTSSVTKVVVVNEGDIGRIGWTGEPIELLFIDISKDWLINDLLLTEFFPHLIPGRSVVIQQDLVFERCPWLAITMEYLSDYFEFLAFVEQNSAVYLNILPIPLDMLHVKIWEFPLHRKIELMDSAIRRFSGGYPKGVMECAKATLFHISGQSGQSIELTADIRQRYADDPVVLKAAERVETAARLAMKTGG